MSQDEPIKRPYICGPLSELSTEDGKQARALYELLAEVCSEVLGVRAFVPHEHFDPIKHANFTPADVDAAERKQVCELTNLLIVVAVAPSWGGGIEVEMANRSNVPVVILRPQDKRVSRLLLGNPAVTQVIDYAPADPTFALAQLRGTLSLLHVQLPQIPSLLDP